MEFPIAAYFVDKCTGEPVQGFVRVALESDLLAWTRWRYGPWDGDKSWDWRRIFLECRHSAGRYECYAALSAHELHGLMVLDLEGPKPAAGDAITVDYLSTNPANRTASEGLKHVGTALMAVAITRSFELGSERRIWLESLPGAERFYEGLGMTQQIGRSESGNVVFILEPEAAKELLEEIRTKGIVAP